MCLIEVCVWCILIFFFRMFTVILLSLCLGTYCLPCHYCMDGNVRYGVNYTFEELEKPACDLPTTVNCSTCTRSSGWIRYNNSVVEFSMFKGCGPVCEAFSSLALELLPVTANTTVLSSQCNLDFECNEAFCNLGFVPSPPFFLFVFVLLVA